MCHASIAFFNERDKVWQLSAQEVAPKVRSSLVFILVCVLQMALRDARIPLMDKKVSQLCAQAV